MKFLFLFFVVSFLFVEFLGTASPVEEVQPLVQLPQAVGGSAVLSRSKRASCPWSPISCEIECKRKGFTTGSCRGGTCVCRY